MTSQPSYIRASDVINVIHAQTVDTAGSLFPPAPALEPGDKAREGKRSLPVGAMLVKKQTIHHKRDARIG